MLQPGATVERYVVQSLVGSGGMASVYMVQHAQLETLHALKVLSVGTASVRERLLVEGRVQATLRHPNIVAVTDVIEVGEQPSLLMDYIAGPSMDQWLREYRPTLEEGCAAFRGVLQGIGYAHKRGLIHRDLKPGNVLLHVEEGEVVPKVTDFGLVKASQGDTPLSNPTRTGATMGTPAYMSPEQIRDASSVDARADLFSLGCILYELLCGRPAFVGQDVLELFNKVAAADYPPPRDIEPGLPDNLVALIDGLLKVDREERIGTCEEALALLGDGPSVLMGSRGSEVAAKLKDTLPLHVPSDQSASTWHGTLHDGRSAPKQTRAPDNTPLYAALVLFATALVILAAVLIGRAGPGEEAVPAKLEPMMAAPAPPEPASVAPASPPTPEVVPVSPAAEVVPAAPAFPKPAADKAAPRVASPRPKAPKGPVGAQVAFEGARMVLLVRGDTKHVLPAKVPPGTYQIRAAFDASAVAAGSVTVHAGEDLTLACVAGFAQCKRK